MYFIRGGREGFLPRGPITRGLLGVYDYQGWGVTKREGVFREGGKRGVGWYFI